VLQQLDFTPFAEEVLMRMEAQAENAYLEDARVKKNIAQLQQRIETLKESLGYRDGIHDKILLDKIEESQNELDALRSRTIFTRNVPDIHYKQVREFLQTLSVKWSSFPRTIRNRILSKIIDHVDLSHQGQIIEATLYWKTGQVQQVIVQRTGLIVKRQPHWSNKELATLEKMWSSANQEELLVALPGRTWKAISNQANKQRWHRVSRSVKPTSRKRWKSSEDQEGKRLYEQGVPVSDIAIKLGKPIGALRQRASSKGWRRPTIIHKSTSLNAMDTNQNPDVSKSITSGIVFGGRSKAPCIRNFALHTW